MEDFYRYLALREELDAFNTGEALEEVRENLGENYTSLANETNEHYRNVTRWHKKGRPYPPLRYLRKLDKLLKLWEVK